MLPPRASRPAADEDAAGVVAVWNGAPLQGGSAKSLGLVRPGDSESTATVTRGAPSSGEPASLGSGPWSDGSDTLDRKSKPVDDDNADEDGEDGDGPATVLNGRKVVMGPASAPSVASGVSTDDDDLNETTRADDDGAETPVGLKKIPAPAPTAKATPVNVSEPALPSAPSAPSANAPESGQTRIAPIVAPPAASALSPNTPAHAWTPPTIPPVAMPPAPLAARAFALPPHKLALVVSMTLMMAALMFVFVRSRQPVPAATAAASPSFPPPVEVLPPAAMQLPPPTLVLPPPAPTVAAVQAQPQPAVATKAPAAPVRPRAPARATSRAIPVHREQ